MSSTWAVECTSVLSVQKVTFQFNLNEMHQIDFDVSLKSYDGDSSE